MHERDNFPLELRPSTARSVYMYYYYANIYMRTHALTKHAALKKMPIHTTTTRRPLAY